MFSLLRRFHEQADYRRSLAVDGPYGPETEPVIQEPPSGPTESNGHLPSIFRFDDDNNIVVIESQN